MINETALSNQIELKLSKNLVRVLKRGNPWVFSDVVKSLPKSKPGVLAKLLDHKGIPLAQGIYDPTITLCFRVCSLNPKENIQKRADKQARKAISLRKSNILENTSGYRLINGEGDCLPGIICDLYENNVVIRLDGKSMENFWDTTSIATVIHNEIGVSSFVLRNRDRSVPTKAFQFQNKEQPKTNDDLAEFHNVEFQENGIRFAANLIHGQKTGFFFDQRDNRNFVKGISKNKRVLNIFGYTGGFSVYAGVGGANHVTTVDLAKPAIELANQNWELNQLNPKNHEGVTQDAYKFLDNSLKGKRKWDLVILDPPSFVPSRKDIEAGTQAYQKLITAGCRVTAPGQFLIASSCSSHISQEAFIQICQEGVSKASRRATVIKINDQPFDHPYPLNLPEFRYLKFVCMQLD